MQLKEDRYMIFLGDIIDRGPYSIELLFVIMFLKYTNYNNVFIINGNHEDYPIYNDIHPQGRTGVEIVKQYSLIELC